MAILIRYNIRKNYKELFLKKLFLSLLCVANFAVAYEHNAQNSLDWEGYYKGELPCASCSGITVWLELNPFDNKVMYELIETYEGNKRETFRTKGSAKWQNEGLELKLIAKDENRVLFVGENFVEFLAKDGKPQGFESNYALKKQDQFVGNFQQLLVDPSSVKVEKKRVRFEGIINFGHRMEGGHKSLAASFELECGKKGYEMPKVSYFRERFATGKLLEKNTKNKGFKMQIVDKEDPLFQAREHYCEVQK